MPYPERLKKLKVPTLVYRREHADMIQVSKLLKGLEDTDPSVFISPSLHQRTLPETDKEAK